MDAITRQRIVSRFLRLGVSGGARSSSEDLTVVEALETELALLREENATLKVEGHRPADTGRIIDGMRKLREARDPLPQDDVDSQARKTPESTGESTTRDGLLEACHEIQLAMQGMRRRLNELSIDPENGSADPAVGGPIAAPSSEEFELELALAAGPEALTQKAA
jgi:hypothetical protein